jgi:hypothetical protein
MGEAMLKQTGIFEAVGSDSETYTVYELTDINNVGAQTDPYAVAEGLKELRTSDGLTVNRIKKGEYQVVQTGVSLFSDSPAAP